MADDLQRTGKGIADVYHRQIDTVYRVCRLFLNSASDAEDAAQEAFVRLIRSEKRFESSEHEKAWLIVTARNVCKNMLRQKKHENVDIATLPEDLMQSEDGRDETLSLLLALEEPYKTVLYLFYYEGYRTAEIAKLLKRKDSTIRSHLLRGRKLLKLELEADAAV